MADLDSLLGELCGSSKLKDVDLFSKKPSADQDTSSTENMPAYKDNKPSSYSAYGNEIKAIMKSHSINDKRKWTETDELSGGWCDLSAPTKKEPEKISKFASFTEPHSKLSVISAKISLDDLSAKLTDKPIINLNRITPSRVPDPKQGNNWVTFGVVARKLPPKESAKGRPFSVWYLTDLNDLDRLETLFLFGGAHEAHWKIPERTVIGLLNPDVREDREKGQLRYTLSVDHPLKLLTLGQSKDFAICQSHTKSGEKCTKVVNKSKCEFCTFHAMTLLKKGTKRPELAAYGSASFLSKRPKMEPSRNEAKRLASSATASAFGPCLLPGKAPIIDSCNATNANASVSSGLPSANHVKSLLPSSCPGVANVVKLEERAKAETTMSKFAFAKTTVSNAEKIDTTSWGRQMLQKIETKVSATTSSSAARARRERLAALVRSGQQPAPSKIDPNRPTNSYNCKPTSPSQFMKTNEEAVQMKSPLTSPSLKTKDDEKAKKILDARSRHSSSVEDALLARQDAYFRALEPRDRAEQKLSDIVKIRVKAIVCKTCLYVASSAADCCKKSHPSAIFGPIDAWRRFFACRDCKFRTTTFSRYPDYSCDRCKSSRWHPAPVREIPKFNPEKLSIGVEELFNDGTDDTDHGNGLEYGIGA